MGLGQGIDVDHVDARSSERGYAMAALLVGMSVLAVLMSMALPVWSHQAKREKEEELIWRGQQYARAVGLFQRKYANTFPPTIDILVEQKFLRKKYKDPITDQDFLPIPAGGQAGVARQPAAPGGNQPASTATATRPQTQTQTQTATPGASAGFGVQQTTQTPGPNQPSIGIQGVVSKSSASSIKMYNGRTKYNEWAFVYLATAQRVGVGGVQRPGVGPQGQSPPGRPPVPAQPPSGASPFGPPGQPPGPGGPPRFDFPRPGAPGQPPQRPPDR